MGLLLELVGAAFRGADRFDERIRERGSISAGRPAATGPAMAPSTSGSRRSPEAWHTGTAPQSANDLNVTPIDNESLHRRVVRRDTNRHAW